MPEPTQPGNPHRLTIHQHTFPVRSIARFAQPNGLVMVFNRRTRRVHPAAPGNPLFYAKRAWDQRTERHMKPVEDAFQRLAEAVVAARCQYEITPDDAEVINRFYALWYFRSRRRELPYEFVTQPGVTGYPLTKDEQEQLESNGVMFVREGGIMAFRHLNGIRLQMDAARYANDDLSAAANWGVIETMEGGEFIVPDVPFHTIIPILPDLALMSPTPNGRITGANLRDLNRAWAAKAEHYFFARHLRKAPM